MLNDGICQLDNNYKRFFLRDVIGQSVLELADSNEKICFVSANVMSSCRVFKALEKFPKRSFCVGIAEQEMIAFSAGLAREGFVPFAFTMAPFMSMRACEQVRTDLAYNRLNVKMIAPYAGVSGGISGATHWALEDCAIMRGIPGITVLEPCDPVQAGKMVEASMNMEGPVYIRVGIESVPSIYNDDYKYNIGKANIVRSGEDGTFICSGVLVKYAIIAANEIFKETGKQIRVVDMHTIKPIDVDVVVSAAKTKRIVVAQDHNIVGGLGEAIATVIASTGLVTNFKIVGIPDRFIVMAHAPFLYEKYGMDAKGLKQSMLALF